MSEEEASAPATDNGTDETNGASADTSRGRGRGRGDRGRGGGRGGRGRGGRGRGGHSGEGDEQPVDESADTEGAAVDESGETEGRGRGRGRGGRGRGRGGVPRSQRPLREVAAPDEAGWTAAKQKHSAAIADINKQIDSYTVKIDSSNKQRKTQREHIKQLTTQLATHTTAKSQLFDQYNKMTQHIDSIETATRETKKSLDQLRRDIQPFNSLLDIDTAIKAEEKKLNGPRQLALAEERAVVDEVRRLRGLRPKVAEYEKKARDGGDAGGRGDVEAHVSDREDVRRQAYEKKEEEERERVKVDEEQKKEKTLTAEIDGWIAKRRELINQRQQEDREWAVKEDDYAKNRSAYDSYAKEKEWRDNEESRRAQEKAEYEERVKRRERYATERQQRDEDDRVWREEREREEAERDPYEKEKYTVVELIKYVSTLSVRAQDDDDEPSVDEKQQQLLDERTKAFGGKQAKPIDRTKKKDSLYESLVTQPKEKKVKPKKQQRVLTHVPDVFALFKVVGVEPPLLSSDVDGCLDKLKERQEFYETAPAVGGGGRSRGRGRGGGGDGRGRGRGGRGGGASGGGDDGGVEYEHEEGGDEEDGGEEQAEETGDAAADEEQPAEEVVAAE